MHKSKLFSLYILLILLIADCGSNQELSIKLTNETSGVIDTITISVAIDKRQSVSAYNLQRFDSITLSFVPEVEGDGELFQAYPRIL
jgi:hypothetical protein